MANIYRKIWEHHNGKIPKDELGRSYEIHHVDGNRDNNNISNLLCISIEEHWQIHYNQGDYNACILIEKRLTKKIRKGYKMSENEYNKIHTKEAHEKVRVKTNNYAHLKNKENREKAVQNRDYSVITKKRLLKMDYCSIIPKLNSPEVILKRSLTKRKPIQQFTKLGEYIRDWSGEAEIIQQLKIYNVGSCCKGLRKYAGGFIWKYKTN